MSRPYNRYRHVTNAMKDAAAARVVLVGHTRCQKCGMWLRDSEIINGVLPEHFLIGKIPCGWREGSPTQLAPDLGRAEANDSNDDVAPSG